jgi:hypothetical protein
MIQIRLLSPTDGSPPDNWFLLAGPTGRWSIRAPRGGLLSALPQPLTEREHRILQSVVDHYASQHADPVTASALVSSALEQVAPGAALNASSSPYDHGLANGLLMALATLKGVEFSPVPHPAVYACELGTWGGRYRWFRSTCSPLRAAWFATVDRFK